ncbi:cellulose biosynthesis protein BcsC, partial [Escherichia coli]
AATRGPTELEIPAGDHPPARTPLANRPATANASLNTQRRVALALAQRGDTAVAQPTVEPVSPLAKSLPASLVSAMVLRDG